MPHPPSRMQDSPGANANARYDRNMARGWESKSVEEQIEQQAQPAENTQSASADAPPTTQQLAAKASRERTRQALELQRDRILDERTSSPIRRAALEAALADIEAKLTHL